MSPAEPLTRRFGDEIFVTWPSQRLTVMFGHFLDGRWGLMAEVSVQSEARGELAWGQLLLISRESRAKYIKGLDADVGACVERACREAVACYRRPPDWQLIEPRTQGAVPWWWQDWIPANQTTVLYGDGDSGKRLLALSIALSSLAHMPLAGTWPVAHTDSVLYVDYESTNEEHAHRLALLCRALEVPTVAGLHYLPAARPLPELGDAIRAQQQRTHAGLVILDSLGAACAGEPESAQAAIAALNTLRQLGPTCTRLVLAHVSKADAAQTGSARKAYGSVYVRNLPRANVEIRRNEGDLEGLSLTLRVDKNNLLHRKPAAIGLSLNVTPDGMAWQPAAPASGAVSLRGRLLGVLPVAMDDARTVKSLCDTLRADPATIRRTLERMADDNLARRVVLGGRGKGEETTWIRVDPKRDSYRDSSATPLDDDPTPP